MAPSEIIQILAVKESNLKLREESDRITQTLVIADSPKNLLIKCAILPLLDGYSQHLNAIRDSAAFKPKSRENAVRILETLSQHISHTMDIAAVTAELISYTQDDSLFCHDVNEFKTV